MAKNISNSHRTAKGIGSTPGLETLPYWSQAAAARRIGISVSMVQYEVRRLRLKAVQTKDGRVLIDAAACEAFAQARQTK